MFLKPFRIKTQSALKNSDRKKLRATIQSQYPTLSDEDVNALIPNKEEMNMTKVSTNGGEIVQIYFVLKNPVVFESFKKVYPTVYALWKFPDLVPVFRTWPPVFGKLQKGADLMLPGVIYDKEPSPKMFGNLKRGDLVSVTLAGNRSPVALGHALLSGEDMYLSALRGKGVGVIHILGDELWEAGDKSQPPSLPEPIPSDSGHPNQADQGEEGIENGEGLPNLETLQIDETSAGANGGASATNGDDEEEEEEEEEDEKDPAAEMDELLHFCFACAIKSRVKKTDLPLLTVNLMRDFMQPFSPSKRLDVKRSSFKKLSKFLHQKVTDGYITTKEQAKGVDTITTIDKTHPGLRDLDVPDAVEEETPNEATPSSEEEINKPLIFTDVYCVNAVTLDLFRVAKLSKGDALILSDVRELVTSYIKENNLQQAGNTKCSEFVRQATICKCYIHDTRVIVLSDLSISSYEETRELTLLLTMVTLDPILAHTILKPVEGDLDHMPWEQVINRVVGKMQQGVAISSSDGLIAIKKGKIEPIKLDVAMRASNKKVTTVENLEEYGFDPKAFARTVQKAVACSCSVVTTEQKNKGPHVLVQGNQVTFIASLLTDKCKIPRKYIVGLDKAPKQKKKR